MAGKAAFYRSRSRLVPSTTTSYAIAIRDACNADKSSTVERWHRWGSRGTIRFLISNPSGSSQPPDTGRGA